MKYTLSEYIIKNIWAFTFAQMGPVTTSRQGRIYVQKKLQS